MKNFRDKYKLSESDEQKALRLPSLNVTFAEQVEGEKPWIDLVRKGTYYYYGDVIEIGDHQFEQAMINFEDGVTNEMVKKDLLFDYDHDYNSSKAAGWITGLRVSGDKMTLQGQVDWSASGKQSLLGDEYRYTSIEFSEFFYVRSMQGDQAVEIDRGFTMFACTLTNKPFVKGMEAVTMSEKSTIAKLADIAHNKKDESKDNSNTGGNMNFEKKYNDMSAKFSEVEGQFVAQGALLEEAQNSVKELTEKIAFSEKNGEFDKLMAEGKTVEAAREAYMADDLKAFAEKSIVLPMVEVGTSEEPVVVEFSEGNVVEKAIVIAKEQNISFSEAMKVAVKDFEDKGEK